MRAVDVWTTTNGILEVDLQGTRNPLAGVVAATVEACSSQEA